MDGMTSDLVLYGMILVGVAGVLLSFWAEIRNRQRSQAQERRRQHDFLRTHEIQTKSADAPAEVEDEDVMPEPSGG
jgi:poly-beta-1,6-N-acetyl-D-glucosamine biosynthesis protein PgaD